MCKPYSNDLRVRVIDCLKQGYKQEAVAEIFKIGLASVQRWWKLYKTKGNTNPKIPDITRPRKIDYAKVIKYIDDNPDKTQNEVGEVFGVKDVWYIIKKMNYTYKKNTSYIRKERKIIDTSLMLK